MVNEASNQVTVCVEATFQISPALGEVIGGMKTSCALRAGKDAAIAEEARAATKVVMLKNFISRCLRRNEKKRGKGGKSVVTSRWSGGDFG